MLYSEVLATDIIPNSIMLNIPATCTECGYETEIDENFVHVRCSNKTCPTKVASRLEILANYLGVDGWGYATSLAMVKSSTPPLLTPLAVLECADKLPETWGQDHGIAGLTQKLAALKAAAEKPVALWEAVMYTSLPGIGSIAQKIFGGYSDMTEAYVNIKAGGPKFIAEMLHTKGIVQSLNVYSTLINAEAELRLAERVFPNRKATTAGMVLLVAITGSVAGYKSKQQYISDLNEAYGDYFRIVLGGAVTAETRFLICDNDSGSAKYNKAQKLIAQGGQIAIVGSEELRGLLNDLCTEASATTAAVPADADEGEE